MKHTTTASTYTVPALGKGLSVISFLCEASYPLSLTEIAQGCKMNTHMALRILHTLARAGWITSESDPPRYRLTLVPFHLASKVLHRTDLVCEAEAPLRDLWQRSGESVGLAVLDQSKVMYLLHFNSVRPISISGKVGAQYLLHCSAPGKIILAWNPPAVLEQTLSEGLERKTRHTLTSAAKLRQDLYQVRKQGFAIDNEEYANGGLCCSAPIFDFQARLVGAVNMSVLTLQYTLEEFLKKWSPEIITTANRISKNLGAPSERAIPVEK